ncbi:MAG TPA: hypothetical protein ENI33_02200 [Thermoplasmatales archaeon]|nr:hypothetical protein [Thermoplasmatales archaeon]
MKISELKSNSNFDEVVLKIIEKKEPRNVIRRYGGTARVCDLIGEDEEGNIIQITLWNEEIDTVEENEKIKIIDGWVKEWNGNLQISTGRNGKIEKIE